MSDQQKDSETTKHQPAQNAVLQAIPDDFAGVVSAGIQCFLNAAPLLIRLALLIGLPPVLLTFFLVSQGAGEQLSLSFALISMSVIDIWHGQNMHILALLVLPLLFRQQARSAYNCFEGFLKSPLAILIPLNLLYAIVMGVLNLKFGSLTFPLYPYGVFIVFACVIWHQKRSLKGAVRLGFVITSGSLIHISLMMLGIFLLNQIPELLVLLVVGWPKIADLASEGGFVDPSSVEELLKTLLFSGDWSAYLRPMLSMLIIQPLKSVLYAFLFLYFVKKRYPEAIVDYFSPAVDTASQTGDNDDNS